VHDLRQWEWRAEELEAAGWFLWTLDRKELNGVREHDDDGMAR